MGPTEKQKIRKEKRKNWFIFAVKTIHTSGSPMTLNRNEEKTEKRGRARLILFLNIHIRMTMSLERCSLELTIAMAIKKHIFN